ncbi:MAG: hypothetical protein ABIA75_15065, partial [Candidatus Neomarinimicrobiota bacterium]
DRQQLELLQKIRLPLDVFYIALLSEKYAGGRGGFIRALRTGCVGWLASLWNIDRTSSILYVAGRK